MGQWTSRLFMQDESGYVLYDKKFDTQPDVFVRILWHRSLVRYVELWGRLEWARFKRGMGLRDDRRRASFYGTYAYREWGKQWDKTGMTSVFTGRVYPSLRRLPSAGVLVCRALAREMAQSRDDAA